jgi:hypothetical protein
MKAIVQNKYGSPAMKHHLYCLQRYLVATYRAYLYWDQRHRTGSVAFFVITIIRTGANLYRNNVLTPEQAESFPLRAP